MKSTKNVIVTGGAGFIGSHLVKKLVDLGHDVIVIDNFSTGSSKNLADYRSRVKVIEEDVGNFEKLQKKIKKLEINIDSLFHLAALPRIERSLDNPLETHQANVSGVFGILELAKALTVKKIIFASSSSVYGDQKKNPLDEKLQPNPQNPYAAHKLIGEVYCDIYSKIYNIPIVILRLFNVYGLGMKGEGAYQLIFTKWIELTKNNQPLSIYGDGKQTRDYTHVSDAIAAFVKAMELDQKNILEIINIGSGRQISVNYLATLFKTKAEHTNPRKFEERFKEANIQKAAKLLKWKPKMSIEKGVEELLSADKLQ